MNSHYRHQHRTAALRTAIATNGAAADPTSSKGAGIEVKSESANAPGNLTGSATRKATPDKAATAPRTKKEIQFQI
jgi:hypothetical protein